MLKIFYCVFFLLYTVEAASQISTHFSEEKQPLFEIGGALFTAEIPNYPGSKKKTFRALPLPWAIYRGDILRMDDEGTRARVQSSPRYEFGISGGFNFPIDTEDNPVRAGMPDLDALIGFGPNFLYRFFINEPKHQLNFNLGLRIAFSTNIKSRLRNEGYVVEPSISYWRFLGENKKLALISSLSITLADKNYNDFFYGVRPIYTTATRGEFRGKAGLTQAVLVQGVSYQITKKMQVFTGGFLSDLSLAANRNSALLEKRRNLGFVIGFTWLFWESDTLVSDQGYSVFN